MDTASMSPPMALLAQLHKLPPAPAPNDDPAAIEGNMSLELKDLAARMLAWHVAAYPGSRIFGHDALAQMKLVKATIRRVTMGDKPELVTEDSFHANEASRGFPLEAQTVCELAVDEGMLNVHGTLAGACSAHIVDVGTFSSLLMLSLATGTNAFGVSASLSINYHSAAKIGTELRVVSTSLSMRGRILTARAEVYDKKTSRLLISAIHCITPFDTASVKSKRKTKL